MFSLCHKTRYPSKFLTRLYNTEAHLSSATIRRRFIEYFVNENDHTFLRSSSLKPLNDHTIPFVNAGMVQFKSVLQGQHLPPALRVTNSQKCARVGGKHNDLDTVGLDGYHHTFFEMLGNWSFGSCNKKEACKMAWELLTGVYGLNANRLYVTYFGGDEQLNLQADFETREIWRQLGVEESHIIPFGTKDNFWEMGLVGPCGPCTEIHVDHEPNRTNAKTRVNAGFSDLTELWNIVFIQYYRNSDESLSPLKQSHVDTGMGFERLVALLNGKKSNYDTDLFTPMMNAIHKITSCPAYSFSFDEKDPSYVRDRAYRILCDHSRLLTVALAESILPQNECKLRWVLRRALNVSHDSMGKNQQLLMELSNYVAESLYDMYPEVGKNLSQVKRIIDDEAEIYKALKGEFPNNWIHLVRDKPELEGLLEFGSNRAALAAAYRKMKTNKASEVPSSLAFHLYETHGMNAELIGEVAKVLGKTFSGEFYLKELENIKKQSKLSTAIGKKPDDLAELLASAEIPKTYDNLKYVYDPITDGYTFPSVSAKVVALIENGELKTALAGGVDCCVVLDRTNFYHMAGGQIGDVGEILVSAQGKTAKTHSSLFVKEVTKVGDYVIHFGNLNGTMKVGDDVMTNIDETSRIACMRNHTLAHLINAQMRHLFDAALQEKCVIQPSFLKLTYCLHGQEFKAEDAKKLDEAIWNHIEDQLRVDRYTVNTWQIPPGTTLVPDETYPVDNIHIIDVKRGKQIVSREACCGTHVLNTKDIGNFCIVEIIKSKRTSLCAVTGREADEAITNSHKLSKDVNKFLGDISELERSVQNLKEAKSLELFSLKSSFDKTLKVHKTYSQIKTFIQENSRRFSYVAYDAAASCLENGLSSINSSARILTELEVQRKAEDARFVVHFLPVSECLGKVPLGKYTKLTHVPIMLFALQDKELKVRCVIPQGIVSENFNAVAWMTVAMSHLMQDEQDAEVISYKKEAQSAHAQSRTLVFKNKISARSRKERCWKASEAAWKFAQIQLKLNNKEIAEEKKN